MSELFRFEIFFLALFVSSVQFTTTLNVMSNMMHRAVSLLLYLTTSSALVSKD